MSSPIVSAPFASLPPSGFKNSSIGPMRQSLVLASSMAALVLASACAAGRIGGLPLAGAERLSEFLEPHAIEALLGFLGLAGVALWLASGGLEGPFASGLGTDGGQAVDEPLREVHLRQSVVWFVRMRWMVLLLASILIAFACFVTHTLESWLWMPLAACVVLLALANVAIGRLDRLFSSARQLLHWQIGMDLIALTVMLHFSGGIENPLALLYLFHVLLAGMLLSRVECYITALGASALFAGLGLVDLARWIPHHTLALPMGSSAGDNASVFAPAYVVIRIAAQTFALGTSAYLTGLIVEHQGRTERELLEMSSRALSESRKLDSVVDSAGAGLMLLDPLMRLAWFNRYAGEWLQLGPESLGQPWAPLASHPGHSLPDAAVTRCSAPPECPVPPAFDITVRHPGKPARILLITATPVRDAQGQCVQVVALLHDITALRQARTQLLHATKLAAIGQLAGSVAHEVNNPVAIIAAKVRLLLGDYRGQLPGNVETELTKVVEQADRLGAMTRRLLTACRPTPGKKSPTNLDEVVGRVLDLVDHRLKEAGVGVTFRPGCRGHEVLANADEMSQVVLNLVNNARDAMPAGGKLTLETSVETAGTPDAQSLVVLRVTDTGTGISPESLEHAFEPFFTTKSHLKGTGLGLAISLSIVQDHGGEIGIESTPGDGTSFTVKLPAGAGGRAREHDGVRDAPASCRPRNE